MHASSRGENEAGEIPQVAAVGATAAMTIDESTNATLTRRSTIPGQVPPRLARWETPGRGRITGVGWLFIASSIWPGPRQAVHPCGLRASRTGVDSPRHSNSPPARHGPRNPDAAVPHIAHFGSSWLRSALASVHLPSGRPVATVCGWVPAATALRLRRKPLSRPKALRNAEAGARCLDLLYPRGRRNVNDPNGSIALREGLLPRLWSSARYVAEPVGARPATGVEPTPPAEKESLSAGSRPPGVRRPTSSSVPSPTVAGDSRRGSFAADWLLFRPFSSLRITSRAAGMERDRLRGIGSPGAIRGCGARTYAGRSSAR